MKRVLIAEDEAVARRLLSAHLEKWGYDVVSTRDGAEAWDRFQEDDRIEIAVLDWNMPQLDGLELCRRMRDSAGDRALYILLCTANTAAEDLIRGLNAGADDYLRKPLHRGELRARLRVGLRTISLETALRERIAELRDALDHVKQLQGLIPICMHCKRMRTENQIWMMVERYLESRGDVVFSHGICDSCLSERYPESVPE
ncbi:MAG: response regulator transcription factor [Planctomycetota bacterium]|nr:response regulator transcription factor [Planctomycetota bacterium]